MLKGVSQCIPTVIILYFGLFNPFHWSVLYTPPPFFNSFQCLSLYPPPSQMLCITILLMLYRSLFPSSFPEFHSVVLILQACSTYMFAYDHVCFCVYVYLLGLSSTYERKKFSLCLSEPSLLHLTWYPPIVSIYLQTTWCHSSIWHIPYFLDPLISCSVSGLFP
jgi:hypothetical protein